MNRTKIIATIGPSTANLSVIRSMHAEGLNVVRINMSHASHVEAKNILDIVRQVNKSQEHKYGPISVLIDTQGPEIRTGESNISLDLKMGQVVNLTVRDDQDVETSSIKINYKGLIDSVKKGSMITIDNGLINFKVLEKNKDNLKCKVIDGGMLGSKRHVNLPGIRVDLPSITKKDILDIKFAINEDVDFIALSFVRSASDVHELRKILDKHQSSIKIISKIENQEGLDNIHDITKASDVVMVARGDLGIETDLANLPNIQRRIMYSAAKFGKRSIVATHLLESMITNPNPTRAEVTDVANAIYEGADALMLSGETSIGSHPVRCIKLIGKIAKQTEKFRTLGYENKLIEDSDWQSLAVLGRDLAQKTDAAGIIVVTRSGTTARVMANTKPHGKTIFVFTNNIKVYRQMSLYGGVKPFYIKNISNQKALLGKINENLKPFLKQKTNRKFVFLSGIHSDKYTDSLQLINL
ncbi:MAG: pyruvate kinase [Gammaproteobacteria bacterium]